jgi:hypothetical protein
LGESDVIPVGLGLCWAGYTLGIWGYCLLQGYNVTFAQLFGATWPGVSVSKTPGKKLGTITSPSVSTTDPGEL